MAAKQTTGETNDARRIKRVKAMVYDRELDRVTSDGDHVLPDAAGLLDVVSVLDRLKPKELADEAIAVLRLAMQESWNGPMPDHVREKATLLFERHEALRLFDSMG